MKRLHGLMSAIALCAAGCGGGATALSTAPMPKPGEAAPYAPAAAARPTTGIALPLGKCVNMGDHLEPPHEGDWGRPIADGDFTIIKQAGFASVRLPVRFSGHALATMPYTIDATFMTRVHHVVDLATAAGLNVIIDMHNDDELYSDPAGNGARFAGLWKLVAADFATAPASVWFELANEPHDKLTNANLLTILNPALAAIRLTNPTRPVIIGGEGYSGVGSLATLPMPADPNVVPTFHSYDPFMFTHQGATFITPTPPLGRRFGGPTDIAGLNANLQAVQDYMARTGRVPFLGEYGANDDPAIPVSERINYYGTMSAAYASIGVQSCAWAYTNAFRLRDGGHWIPGMVEALRTTTTAR
ncbi:glycoside hydrolase family 5 protein [Sphingomonas oligophenolica]|uniref:Glycoside hydrolase family 5 protein n=1 Tax=Sphingomonas oligophenolica TaxID=301154 RepID=A0ABU9XZM6_9SPHN